MTVQIDWSNNFARHLKFSVLYNEAGPPRDLISRLRSTIASGNPISGIKNNVLVGEYDGVGDAHDFDATSHIFNDKPFTICWRGQSSGIGAICGLFCSSSGGGGVVIYRTTEASYDDITFGATNGSTVFSTKRFQNLDAPDALNTWFLVFDGVDQSQTSSFKLFEGKVEHAATAGSALSGTTAINTLGNRGNHDIALTGYLEFFHIFDMAFTEQQVHNFVDNPYQLFKAQPIIGAHQLPTHVDYGMVKMPWTSQPPAGTPIDWGNPLAQGLVFLTVGTDPDRDLVDGRVGTVTGTLGPTIDPKYGIGVDHDETNWIEFTHVPRYSSDFVSATCIVNPDNLTGANYQEVMRKGDNSGTQDYDLLLNFPSGGEINFNIWNSGAKSSPGAPLTIGETSVVTGTYNGAELRIYKDGREYGSPTAWTGGIEQSTDSLGVGARVKGTVDRKTDAQIYFVAVHNRALSAGEIRSLHENPWQIFKPKEIMVPINEDLPELGRFEIQS